MTLAENIQRQASRSVPLMKMRRQEEGVKQETEVAQGIKSDVIKRKYKTDSIPLRNQSKASKNPRLLKHAAN